MSVASTLLLAASGLGIAYLALAAASLARLSRRPIPALGRAPAVTVLKPLHGAEPGLRANLETFLRQDYPGAVQFVFGVQSAADPAGEIVRDLQQAFPERDIELVVEPRQHGTNRKVSNLVNMDARARHEVVVLADSDMRVRPDDLRKVLALLGGAGVGAVTCPYHGLPADDVWARLVALGIDTHFLPGVAVGIGLGLGRPCMGSMIALRRETLDRIGGFRSLADDLADDHVLGARVRAQGLSVVVAPFTVAHACPGGGLDVLLGQELRWLRTIRQIEPAGHVGSLVAHPLPFALLAFALEPGAPAAIAVIAAILARIGLCLAAERSFGLNRHAYGIVPARDLLSFALLVTSFFGRGVSWRGYRYEVARSGALLPRTRPDPT